MRSQQLYRQRGIRYGTLMKEDDVHTIERDVPLPTIK